MDKKELVSTKSHILSSRQILGPITLAAPDTRRKAKCFGGQGAESPHLYLRGRGSAEIYDRLVNGDKEDRGATIILYRKSRHKMVILYSCLYLPGVGSSLAPEKTQHFSPASLDDFIHRPSINMRKN